MRYLSKEELGSLYFIIERAVETKSEIKFPKGFCSDLSLIVVDKGLRFIIPELRWRKGEDRYNVLLRMEFKDNNLNTPCLYVDGHITNGSITGDELWMINNQYRDKLPSYAFIHR